MGQGNFTEDFKLDAIKQITERGQQRTLTRRAEYQDFQGTRGRVTLSSFNT